MNKKHRVSYEAPTTDALELRFEGGVMTFSDNINSSNHTEYLNGDLDFGYEEL